MRRFVLLLVLAVPLGAQTPPPWNGIISTTRAVDWSGEGLPTSFPDGENTKNPWTPPTGRTQCGTTRPNGDTEAAIQGAYNLCAAGTFLLLGPGTFTPWTATFNMRSNVDLVGSGADPVTGTTIDCGGNTTTNISCPSWASGVAHNCTWTGFATATAGATQTTITGCTPNVNDLIVFEVNGPTFDPGTADFYVCAPGAYGICGQNAPGGSPTGQIEQLVRVTDFSSPPTVKFDPPLQFNFSNTNYTNPVSAIISSPVTGAGLMNMRIKGDLTLNGTNPPSGVVFMANGYADYMTGVQIVGAVNGVAPTSTVVIQDCHHCLVFTNDIWQGLTTAGGAAITKKVVSNSLILNNDMHVGNDYCQPTGCVNNVDAYNYIHDSYYPTSNTIITNVQVEHTFSMVNLFEGNEAGGVQIDEDHEGHAMDTFFRNNYYGSDQPFLNPQGIRALEISGYARYMNAVGNVLCASTSAFASPCTKYIGSPDGLGGTNNCVSGSSVYWIGCNGQPSPMDIYALQTAMLWGNCDGFNKACRFVSSEVPTNYTEAVGHQLALGGSGNSWSGTISGSNPFCVAGTPIVTSLTFPTGASFPGTNAVAWDFASNGTLVAGRGVSAATVNCTTGAVSVTTTVSPPGMSVNYLVNTATAGARQNAVPASHTLPPSFNSNLPQTTFPNGGTGISWWKVCTNYPTCTTFVTQPWPLAGPDVANGPFTTVSGGATGTAYDTPMAIWEANAPTDTTLQTSYSIASSSWASGVNTLVLSSNISAIVVTGKFDIQNASGCNGTKFHIIASAPNTPISGQYQIKYAVGSNPGTCVGGQVLFPDVPRFSNTAFTADLANQCGTPTFSPLSGYAGPSLNVTISQAGICSPGATACYTTDGTTPTANGAGICVHGTQSSFPATVPVSTSETIQCIASKSGFVDSLVGSATYTIIGAETPLMRMVM